MINIVYSVKTFLIGYVSFIVLDILWLGFVMRDFYERHLAAHTRIVNEAVVINWPSALLVWALLVIGLMIFVVHHQWATSAFQQIILGMFYGLIVYGVYEGTNFAIMRQWPLSLAAIDIVWGMIINGWIALILYFI